MSPRILIVCASLLAGCDHPTTTTSPADATPPAPESEAAAPESPAAVAQSSEDPAVPEPEPPSECDAQVAEVPTALFGEKILIRPPVGVELVEETPSVAMTYSTFVSTCDAVVDRMQLMVFANDKRKPLGTYLSEFLVGLENAGYKDGQLTPMGESAAEVLSAVDFPAAGGLPPAKLLIAVERVLDNVVIVVYQTQPDQWPGLSKTFVASARSLLVVPDAT